MKRLTFFLLVLLVACNSKDKYDPSKYYDATEQAEVLSGIVTYIFSAPPYTAMKDRFKEEHKVWYRQASARLFKLDQLYIDGKGHSYYLVMRPGNTPQTRRAAGGYFDTDGNQLRNFHETFVTPILADSIAKIKGRFLFDQMVNGDLQKYLVMQSYVQWPNPISHYDTIDYEWKTDLSQQDSVTTDTTRSN